MSNFNFLIQKAQEFEEKAKEENIQESEENTQEENVEGNTIEVTIQNNELERIGVNNLTLQEEKFEVIPSEKKQRRRRIENLYSCPEYVNVIMKLRAVISVHKEYANSFSRLSRDSGLPLTQINRVLKFQTLIKNSTLEFFINFFQINPIWLFTNQPNQRAFLFSNDYEYHDQLMLNTANISKLVQQKKAFDWTSLRYFKKCNVLIDRHKQILFLIMPTFSTKHYTVRLRIKEIFFILGYYINCISNLGPLDLKVNILLSDVLESYEKVRSDLLLSTSQKIKINTAFRNYVDRFNGMSINQLLNTLIGKSILKEKDWESIQPNDYPDKILDIVKFDEDFQEQLHQKITQDKLNQFAKNIIIRMYSQSYSIESIASILCISTQQVKDVLNLN